MTVLVDAAVWKWQGARWAHLVSDESFDELHEFAQRIGKRRLGFQGDHYDVWGERQRTGSRVAFVDEQGVREQIGADGDGALAREHAEQEQGG